MHGNVDENQLPQLDRPKVHPHQIEFFRQTYALQKRGRKISLLCPSYKNKKEPLK
jgi:hypothetical protein